MTTYNWESNMQNGLGSKI